MVELDVDFKFVFGDDGAEFFHRRGGLEAAEAGGFAADRRPYLGQWGNDLREVAASANALLELYVTRPLPVLGQPEPIR